MPAAQHAIEYSYQRRSLDSEAEQEWALAIDQVLGGVARHSACTFLACETILEIYFYLFLISSFYVKIIIINLDIPLNITIKSVYKSINLLY